MTTTPSLRIPLDKIEPSGSNPRKTFDAGELAALAASIVEHDIISPIKVRPHPTKNHSFMLVAGERRWRAAKFAKLTDIPAVVEALTDQQVIEQQIVENTQRVDIHPLEEADGYRALLTEHKYTVEKIVEQTGKSRSWVYGRLELCKLAPVPRKAFIEGRLNASVALLIARIPDVKLQTSATAEVLGEGGYDDYEIECPTDLEYQDDKGKRMREPSPLSVRAAMIHIQKKYMLRLERAPFDVADAKLVAKAGACTICPYRTGNQPELFSDVKSPDVCTKPSCFDDKKRADWDAKAAIATRSGMRVLSDKETDKVFERYDPTKIQHGSAYVDPEQKLPHELDPTGKKTWKVLLGKTEPAKALAKDAAGGARVLWDKQSAIATAKKSGALKEAKAEAKARGKASEKNPYAEQQRKRDQDAKKRKRIVELGLAKIAAAAVKDQGIGAGFWHPFLACLLRLVNEDCCRVVCKRRGGDPGALGQGKAEKLLLEMAIKGSVAEARSMAVELVAAESATGGAWSSGYGKSFLAWCSVYGLDVKKLGVEAAKEAKAATKTDGRGVCATCDDSVSTTQDGVIAAHWVRKDGGKLVRANAGSGSKCRGGGKSPAPKKAAGK